MSLFIFSLCHHVTFYKTLTSLSTVFIKAHVGLSTTFKVAVSHFVFYPYRALAIQSVIPECSVISNIISHIDSLFPRLRTDPVAF